MLAGVLESAECARAFTDEIGSRLLPVDFGGVSGRSQMNLAVIYKQLAVAYLNFTRKASMSRVVLEHVREVLSRHAAVHVRHRLDEENNRTMQLPMTNKYRITPQFSLYRQTDTETLHISASHGGQIQNYSKTGEVA